MANLIIIARNDQPRCDEDHQQIWLLSKSGETIEIHVGYDLLSRPHVLGKSAA